jgi:molecular chaperone DnaK
VENALADAKKALEGTDAAAMTKARDQLQAASHKLAEAMYKASSTQTPPQGGPEPGANGAGPSAGESQKKDEGVIDAEYVDVEDKK